MSEAILRHAITSAIAVGILPPSAADTDTGRRPWALVALSMVGVWLAALPLIGVIALFLPTQWATPFTLFLLAIIAIAASLYGLHEQFESIVAEQLCFIALLIGCGLFAGGLGLSTGYRYIAAPLALLTFTISFLHSRHWLHVALGAVTFVLSQYALLQLIDNFERHLTWLTLVIPLAAWMGMRLVAVVLATNEEMPNIAVTLDAFAAGWGPMLLVYVAYTAGQTFLVGSLLPINFRIPLEAGAVSSSASLILASIACLWFLHSRPSLPIAGAVLVVPVALGLAWLAPSFGVVLLMLVACVQSVQRRQAVAAGVAGAWTIGALYYSLSIPLGTTAVLLLLAGVVVATAAWRPRLWQFVHPPNEQQRSDHRARFAILLCAVMVFATVNIGILQKERMIAGGRTIFVELAPVDPRSLMQGDFMRLGYRLPPEIVDQLTPDGPQRVIGNVDTHGILTIEKIAQNTPLTAGEIAIDLTPTVRGWIIATDAWYFSEGDGNRWAAARYGEFRVMANGKAVLVNLRGANLKPL